MSAPAHASSNLPLFFKVYVALLALLLLTVGAAYVHLGPFNIIVTLLIAGVKAWMVVMFFMHLNHGALLTRLIAIGSFIWLVILIVGVLMDYLSMPESRFGQDLRF
ncbi:MAG TPA: cytochrome C oxidase subunit IV family protein [Caulifigura sp.]|jgi:cytochrome c oxidase subunit 4|nr:cytochrome C oxidase subunit IV family protein [Caulifigura sp.]